MRKSNDFNYHLIYMFSMCKSPIQSSVPSSMCLISYCQMDSVRNDSSPIHSKFNYVLLDNCNSAIVDSFFLHNPFFLTWPDEDPQWASLHLDFKYRSTTFPSICIQSLILYLATWSNPVNRFTAFSLTHLQFLLQQRQMDLLKMSVTSRHFAAFNLNDFSWLLT